MANDDRKPSTIFIEAPPGSPRGLGDLIERTLLRMLSVFYNRAAQPISETLEWGLELLIEAIEEALIDTNKGMIQDVMSGLPSDSPVIGYLESLIRTPSIAGIAALGGFASTMGSSAAGNMLSVLMRPLGYELDSELNTARLDPGAAIAAIWRGVLDRTTAVDQLADLGWSGAAVGVWDAILRPVTSERDSLTLWLREEISGIGLRDRLEYLGYEAQAIGDMKTVVRPLTGPDDLRTLMLREIISSGAFVNRLGHHGYTDGQVDEFLALSARLLAGGDIVELYRRGVIGEGTLVQRLAHHGYEPAQVSEIAEVGRPLTGLGELTSLFWREMIEEGGYAERIGQHGYDEGQIAEFVELSKRIPGPGDLVGMAVREAFSPEIVEEYQYLAEFPPEFAEWMVKQGYEEEWAEKYWIAHWRLPSLSMAYEMFHREIITEPELNRLFAISDIAPFWRPKLREAAYRPLTRVDVRRMYQLGVLTIGAVYRSYLDLGYSPENAEYMTLFTERYVGEGEREVTKTDILAAYRAGVLGRGDANELLTAIDYSGAWAEYFLLVEDAKIEAALLSAEIAAVKAQYIAGTIDRSDVFVALGAWDMPDRQIRALLKLWDVIKAGKINLPTASQLESFLKQDIIGEGTYREQMARRHYPAEAIGFFLQEIRFQMQEAAIAEEERAREEQLKIQRKEVKSEYEIERSRLNVEIAELKTALAENMVQLGIIVDWEIIEQLLRQNDQLKLRIKELEEDKARVKLALASQLAGMIVPA